MYTFLNMVAYGVAGAVLAIGGITTTNWEFWVVMVTLFAVQTVATFRAEG